MKVLIIEDEPRAANRLEKMISKLSTGMEVVAKLESVRDSVNYLKSDNGIQLIFADVQLADGLSFEIFKTIKVTCPIIFTTAYDQYAIEAFKTNGIDYLLKPIEEDRLKQAIDKLANLIPKINLENLLALAGAYPAAGKKFKSRFIVKVGENIKTISTDEIKAFYSLEKATFILTTNNRNYIIDYSLDRLEGSVDPQQFFRINRKYIVSIATCTKIYQWSNSRLKIEINGLENDEIIVARERVQDFKEWLDQ